ncbi:2-phosphoxylose phosphatase 1 [Amyelois transitella]|uniref:2-phosphoxylose phosphatase 1 n=1 Tax=Amyelois transitella TaxID=680683 RepID=UPI0029902B24|nr:2-phosphoxylose phosphatase 1 [Amyelois transitella]
MSNPFSNRSKFITEIMKFSFHHRAFYCYLGMSLWIFFLITVMYKYMSTGEDSAVVKKVIQNELMSRTDSKFRKIYLRVCSPPDNIVRGSEGVVDSDTWLLQGVLVLTRHGDRGPLTHLKGGDKLPCDTVPISPLLKSYEEYVANASGSGRPWWVSGPGPFHNFPSLPPRAGSTHCALGQLTPRGLLQMLTVGNILREAYAAKLGLDNFDSTGKKDTGLAISYSTRYRRTFQSLCAAWWGAARGAAGARLAAAREAPSAAFCFRDCACAASARLTKKINSQDQNRLESHPAVKELVSKLSKVLFESQERPAAHVVRDALLAYMCHDAPLPCTTDKVGGKANLLIKGHKKFRGENIGLRNLLDVDIDTLNMELDYINNQLDFNNEVGRKARDIIGKYYDSKDKKAPLDFDAQMEREKLLYYQQKYMDNDIYDDVVIVKKNLDADFNFPNDARMDADFDEDYKEPTESTEEFCVKKEHVMSLFAYLEWTYRQEIKNIHNKRRGLLVAYGLIHNIVQNMIRMISENKPKFVLYSGHDKTLQALILALGLNNYQHYNIQYAARMIFEVYRKKDLLDEFKFTKRKAVAQDFYFRVVYNGEDVTNKLSFCKPRQIVVMKVVDPIDDVKMYNTYLCPIESIVRFIHDDYFATFNTSNYKDACASYGNKHL